MKKSVTNDIKSDKADLLSAGFTISQEEITNLGVGTLTYWLWQNFCRKLKIMKKIRRGGGVRAYLVPPRSATASAVTDFVFLVDTIRVLSRYNNITFRLYTLTIQ